MTDFLHTITQGTFKGVLTWDGLDRLWEKIETTRQTGWFAYTVGEPPPTHPAYGDQLTTFLKEVHALLRRRHRHDHCGVVYVDDPESPQFVIVYDPSKIGGCGLGDGQPLPGWVLSRQPPMDLIQAMAPVAPLKPWQKASRWLSRKQ